MVICPKSTVNKTLIGEVLEAFPLNEVRKGQKCLLSLFPLNSVLEFLFRTVKQEEIMDLRNGKKKTEQPQRK